MPTSMLRNDDLASIEIKEGAWEEYSTRHHSHEELQIGFVEQGSSTIICKALSFEMKAGQAIMIPPDIIHLCQPDEANRFKFTVLYIEKGWFEAAFRIDSGRLKPQTSQLDPQTMQDKERFISSFKSESDPMNMESMAIMFLGGFIFRSFDLQTLKEDSSPGQTELATIEKFIDEKFSEAVQLDDLVRISGMSKFSLLRRFKKQYKLAPHAYLVNKRVNHAKQLLLEGQTVAQTAVSCGFFDQSHFVKTFRQYVGIAPIDYK